MFIVPSCNYFFFFFSSRRRHTSCALVTGVQTCALPIYEVVLNQVVVAFGDDARTQRVIAAIQDDGTCWCGGTTWKGRAAMRISISSWATSDADVESSAAAILDAYRTA